MRKKYEGPETPYDRVMRNERVSAKAKEKLKQEFERANPYELKTRIEKSLKGYSS